VALWLLAAWVSAPATAGPGIGPLLPNLHAVVPGEAYRSALLAPSTLERVIGEKKLRCVVRLCGKDPGDHDYQDEARVCARRGIEFHAFGFSATRLPAAAELNRLLDTLDAAPRPLLFHCRYGADRTGLVATLYLHLYRGVPLDEAQRRGLSWRYGHLAFGPARPMADFLDVYRRSGGGLGLRSWIRETYPALYAARRRLPPAAPALPVLPEGGNPGAGLERPLR
jgi:undecaprenyl-diphosphatase